MNRGYILYSLPKCSGLPGPGHLLWVWLVRVGLQRWAQRVGMSDNKKALAVNLLVEELSGVAEWYTLGAFLGLTESEIKEIEQDHVETARRRMAMLSKWIKKEADPSWLVIIAALEKMSETSLANQLRKKYARDDKVAKTCSADPTTLNEPKEVIIKMNRKELIGRKLEDVEKRYLKLIVETESAMKQVDPSAEQLNRFSGFYTSVRATTVGELFNHLEQYCFLDYTLLEMVIFFFLEDLAPFVVSEFHAYNRHLEEFKSSTTIRQFMESIEKAQKQLTTTTGGVETCTVCLRLVGGWLEKTMADLDELLKELFQDKKSVLSHIQILRGSVIVTYSAPQLKAESLISIAMQVKLSLSQVGVYSIQIAETFGVADMQIDPFISFERSLYKAILDTDINLLKLLLRMNTDPNKIEKFPQIQDSVSSLFVAIINEADLHQMHSIVGLLLKAGADPNLQLKDGGTPLYVASQSGYTDIVRLLVQANANPNLQLLSDGSSALHLASQRGHSDVVRILLNAKANPNFQAKEGSTALSAACFDGDSAIVDMLLRAHADPNIPSDGNVTPLHKATQNGYCDVVNMLLKANANPNVQADNGATPLHIPCQNGLFNIVELLLEAKADPNIQADNGSTPLFMASQYGYANIVGLLLAAKANPDVFCKGKVALHIASVSGHSNVVDSLLKANANPDSQGIDGFTPLILACENGHFSVVDLLLKANANPNLSMHKGLTPLMAASRFGHSDIVRILLDANADPNHQTDQCGSPIVHACFYHKPGIVRLLLTRGADPNLQHPASGLNALMYASFSGCLESLELLLISGADPSVLSLRGLSALHLAAICGHEDIVHLIQAVELSQSSSNSPVLTTNEIASYVSNESLSLLKESMEAMLVAESEALVSTHFKNFDKTLQPKHSHRTPLTLNLPVMK